MVQAWNSRPLSNVFIRGESPMGIEIANCTIRNATTTPPILTHLEAAPMTRSRPYTQANTAAILTMLISRKTGLISIRSSYVWHRRARRLGLLLLRLAEDARRAHQEHQDQNGERDGV